MRRSLYQFSTTAVSAIMCPSGIEIVFYLLAALAASVQSLCGGSELACLSRGPLPNLQCIERNSLCADGEPSSICRVDVLKNITLQCADHPPSFMCDGESYALQELCDGVVQCSDKSDENYLLCKGVSQLPFLKSGNGVATTENQSSSLESVLFINLPDGLPFGASFQTNFTVSIDGYIIFGARPTQLSFPQNIMEFPSLNLSYILAPFWTGVNDGVIGEVRCEQYGAQERVGATLVLDKVANFIIETDPDVGVFNPTWMLLCEWNNVSSAQMLPLKNTFQALVLTDGIDKSFAVFTYKCNLLQWPLVNSDLYQQAIIGFQGDTDFYALHPLSSRNNTRDIACANYPATRWNNVVYQLSPKPNKTTSVSREESSSKDCCKTSADVINILFPDLPTSTDTIPMPSSPVASLFTQIQITTTSSRVHSNAVSVILTTPGVYLDHLPQSGFGKQYFILMGSVGSAAVLVIIVLILLSVTLCKLTRGKNNAELLDSFNRGTICDETDVDDYWNATNSTMISSEEKTVSLHAGGHATPHVAIDIGGKHEVPFSSLDLREKLGTGDFGTTYKAALRNLCYPHRQPKLCVVKLLKDSATMMERATLLSRCLLMQGLEAHPHILKMIGCCTTGNRIALILEHCSLGNLRDFLIRNRSNYQEVSSRRQSAVNLGTPSSVYSRTPASSMLDVEEIGCVEQAAISVIELSSGWEYNRRLDKEDSEDENVKLALRTLLSFGRQITLGMEYLAQKKIVHRELTARKILVCQNLKLKISDFGVSSTNIYDDLHYNMGRKTASLRWTALEAINESLFTSMSDMWSFGVVLWEIITLGSFPYPEFSNSEVLEKVTTGYRMPKPRNCPHYLYELMLSCWSEEASSRPSFKAARRHIDQIITTTIEAEEYLLLVEGKLTA